MPQHTAFQQSRRELDKAKDALDAFAGAQDFESARREWENFLSYIDRAYNKLSYASRLGGRVSGRIGLIKNARSQDELLQYLMQARNISEHGIEEITAVSENYGIQGVPLDPSKTVIIKDLRIDDKGGITYRSGENVVFQRIFAGVNLLAIVSRGVKYRVPVIHLGNEVNSTAPTKIGQLALDFYNRKLDELEAL